MSALGGGLPPIDQSTLPADIRNGSTERKRSYEAALGFERMFLQELTKTLADTANPIDGGDGSDGADGSSGSDVATQSYQDMLPQTLTDNIMSAGGLGLARQLVPVEKTSSSPATQTSMSRGQGQ